MPARRVEVPKQEVNRARVELLEDFKDEVTSEKLLASSGTTSLKVIYSIVERALVSCIELAGEVNAEDVRTAVTRIVDALTRTKGAAAAEQVMLSWSAALLVWRFERPCSRYTARIRIHGVLHPSNLEHYCT